MPTPVGTYEPDADWLLNVRKFDPHQLRVPGGEHGGEWTHNPVSSAVEKLAHALTGQDALNAPPLNLEHLTAAGDHRADALWYRTGDNSVELHGELGFEKLNAYLRGGGGPGGGKAGLVRGSMSSRVADIDSAMRDSKLSKPILVSRGISSAALGTPGELRGVEFSDRAFVSTTTNEAHAKTFGGALMRILVPPGIGAIRTADRNPDRPESEILLDRGLSFRVVAERVEFNERGRITLHELDVEIVP